MTCYICFAPYTSPSFPTDRTLFHSEGPVFEGWRNIPIQATNGWGTFPVHSRSLQPATRTLHTWPTSRLSFPGPTLPWSEPAQICVAPTTSSWARANTSFSRPYVSRREVLYGSPCRGGGAWPTSFGNASLTRYQCTCRARPRVTVTSLPNGCAPFGRHRRR